MEIVRLPIDESSKPIYSMDISKDSTYFALSSFNNIIVFDYGEVMKYFNQEPNEYSNITASTEEDSQKYTVLEKPNFRKMTLKFHKYEIASLKFKNLDDDILFSAGADKFIVIWRMYPNFTYEKLRVIPLPSEPTSLSLFPYDSVLLFSDIRGDITPIFCDYENSEFSISSPLDAHGGARAVSVVADPNAENSGRFASLGEDGKVVIGEVRGRGKGMKARLIKSFDSFVDPNHKCNILHKKIDWQYGFIISVDHHLINNGETRIMHTKLIDDSNFDNVKIILGHESPSLIASISPHLYFFPKSDGHVPFSFRLVASSDRLGNLVLWRLYKNGVFRHVQSVNRVSESPVTDVIWARDGGSLLMANSSGMLIFVGVDKDRFNIPHSKEELKEPEKIEIHNNCSKEKHEIREKINDKSAKSSKSHQINKENTINNNNINTNKNGEKYLGKKRITPTLISGPRPIAKNHVYDNNRTEEDNDTNNTIRETEKEDSLFSDEERGGGLKQCLKRHFNSLYKSIKGNQNLNSFNMQDINKLANDSLVTLVNQNALSGFFTSLVNTFSKTLNKSVSSHLNLNYQLPIESINQKFILNNIRTSNNKPLVLHIESMLNRDYSSISTYIGENFKIYFRKLDKVYIKKFIFNDYFYAYFDSNNTLNVYTILNTPLMTNVFSDEIKLMNNSANYLITVSIFNDIVIYDVFNNKKLIPNTIKLNLGQEVAELKIDNIYLFSPETLLIQVTENNIYSGAFKKYKLYYFMYKEMLSKDYNYELTKNEENLINLMKINNTFSYTGLLTQCNFNEAYGMNDEQLISIDSYITQLYELIIKNGITENNIKIINDYLANFQQSNCNLEFLYHDFLLLKDNYLNELRMNSYRILIKDYISGGMQNVTMNKDNQYKIAPQGK